MAYSCDLSIVSPLLPYARVLERWLMYTGLFDQEVLRAFYKTELVNFDSEAINCVGSNGIEWETTT